VYKLFGILQKFIGFTCTDPNNPSPEKRGFLGGIAQARVTYAKNARNNNFSLCRIARLFAGFPAPRTAKCPDNGKIPQNLPARQTGILTNTGNILEKKRTGSLFFRPPCPGLTTR